ncbi:hypothetical protein DL93DRAFT_412790 [Clavulina sp. PMI_390]|nr:hypothetical protein DL93DRAFT_412790 [Clavulina sp. PMI_390]
MAMDAFSRARESIKSLDGFINTISFDAKPAILHHLPSSRDSHKATIQNNLAILEGFCTEIGLIFQTISQMRDRLLLHKAACISAFAPITAMPVELLREVFRLVAVSNRSAIPNLSAVCRSWQSIMSEQHELWTSIVLRAGDPCRSVVTHRDRSGSLPLSLEVDALRYSWPQRLKKAFPDMEERLQTLRWTSSASIQGFMYPERHAIFSALHTIKFSPPQGCETCGLDEMVSHGRFLFNASFPSLRRLEVTNVPDLEIPQGVVETLEHLKMHGSALNWISCRKILQNVPFLKSLEIRDPVEDSLDPPPNGLHQDLTVVPNLEALTYQTTPTDLVAYLSRNFTFPILSSFRLTWSTPSTTAPFLPDFMHALGIFVSVVYRTLVLPFSNRCSLNKLS